MAFTQFNTDDINTVKKWSRDVVREADQSFAFAKFIGEGDSSLIKRVSDLARGSGDACRVPFLYKLRGEGVTGDVSVEDKAESQQYRDDVLVINETRHNVTVPNRGSIGAKRVAFNTMEQARLQMTDWVNTKKTISLYTQLCGYRAIDYLIDGLVYPTYQAVGNFTGHNAPYPPQAGNSRWFSPQGLTEDKLATTPAAAFTSRRIIDQLVKRAELANPVFRKLSIPGYEGDASYILFLHPSQVADFKSSNTANEWTDITKYQFMGRGKDGNSPLIDGIVGVYNQTLVVQSRYVTEGVGEDGHRLPNVRRAVFCGASALLYATGGSDYEGTREPWRVYIGFKDADKWVEFVPSLIWGIKKTVYQYEGRDIINPINNAGEYATFIFSTYANDTAASDPSIFAPVGSAPEEGGGGNGGGQTFAVKGTQAAQAQVINAMQQLEFAKESGDPKAVAKANRALEKAQKAAEKTVSNGEADEEREGQEKAYKLEMRNGNNPQDVEK